MPDEEFIEAYAQGRVSRRAFVRRLVAGGLSVGAALAYSAALAPGAAEALPRKPPPKFGQIHKPVHAHRRFP